jgi:hypothetical protein
VVAIVSSSLRTPQEISSGETGVSVAPERGFDAHRGELGVARALERGADVSDLGCDLLERPVRDPLAVGEAPPDEHARLHTPEQLPREARLPDARGADNRRELRRSGAEGRSDRLLELLQLRPTSDEGRRDGARERGDVVQ